MTSACYDLIVKKVDEERPRQVPTKMNKLLKEYWDITLKDLLVGLPPNRGITHHIYLIPGLSLLKQDA